MPGCEAGEHTFTVQFDVDPSHVACQRLSLNVSAGAARLVSVSLNGGRTLLEAPNATLRGEPSADHTFFSALGLADGLRGGRNSLIAAIQVAKDDDPCGVYVAGVVSAYVPLAAKRIYESETDVLDGANAKFVIAAFDEPLPPNSLLIGEFSFTNAAGLGAARRSAPMLLDDSPPRHPNVTACTPGGHFDADGWYYQRHVENVTLCWEPPGFTDDESDVWRLEYQVARWSLDQYQWDIYLPTQVLSYHETRAALVAGRLTIRSEINGSDWDLLSLNNRYRVGLRAVNRAGIRRCESMMRTRDCSRKYNPHPRPTPAGAKALPPPQLRLWRAYGFVGFESLLQTAALRR